MKIDFCVAVGLMRARGVDSLGVNPLHESPPGALHGQGYSLGNASYLRVRWRRGAGVGETAAERRSSEGRRGPD